MSKSSSEQVVFGVRACQALFSHRPEDILRLFHHRDRAKELVTQLQWAARNKRVYREVDTDSLGKLAKSPHHEGVVIVAKPLQYKTMTLQSVGRTRSWMVLDGVTNPHNLGAILRTCGFFGVQAALVGGVAPESKVNSAALRVAQGGAESLQLFAAQDLPLALNLLRDKGLALVGLETDARDELGASPLPSMCALILGHEQQGLSPEVRKACDRVLAIPGGAGRQGGKRPGVGSLNVSVAAALGIFEMMRTRRPPTAPRKPASAPGLKPVK